MRKYFLFLFILGAFISVINARAASVRVDENNIRYTVDDEAMKAEVYGPVSSSTIITNLVIPDYIQYNDKSIPVVSIRDRAFSSNKNLRGSLTIGDNVQSIGNNAFWSCSGFTGSLTIGANVQTIGNNAFQYCSGFTDSLTLGDNVQTIGESAFSSCSGFNGSLTLGDNVQTIGNYAFYNCTGFTGSLTIGDNVQTIGNFAFNGCSSFKGSLTLGDNVQSIGNYAFWGCSGFTGSLTIGDNVQSIGESAFLSCSGFTGSLTIGDNVQSIGESAFRNCSGFTGSLTIGDNVKTIGNNAFDECTGFTGSLTIPNSVQTIGTSAFAYCSGFTGSLIIPENVQSIGNSAFFYCGGFNGDLIIGKNVKRIGRFAFENCNGLTGKLILPFGLEYIGGAAFEYCSNLKEIMIPESVQYIGSRSFHLCKNLEGIVSIPEGVEIIYSSAFEDCIKLRGLIISSTVKEIGVHEDLDGVSMGNTNAGFSFVACESLEYIICNSINPPKCYYENNFLYTGTNSGTLRDRIYDNVPLYVPAESVTLYKNAAEWKKFKNINPIPVEAAEITLNKNALSLLIGQEETLIATLQPEGATAEVVWSVVDDSPIISINSDGKVTALAVGEATVKATAGDVSATCKVTVYGPDDVTVKPGEGTNPGDEDDTPGNNTENGGSLVGNDLTLRVNQSAAIDVVIPEGLSVEPKFAWILDNGGAELVSMTVKDNTLSATFRGLKVGNTGYTVSIVGVNGNIEAVKGKITVIAEVPMTSLELEPASITMAQNALPQTIKPDYTPDNASMPEFNWTSSVPTVASVDQNGKVTPVGQGQTVITCTALDGSGLSATCKVTVTEPIDENFEFEFDESVMGGKEGISLYIGDIYKFIPKAKDGYVLPEIINWTSSDDKTVSVTEEGLVTALALGKATITASATVNGKEVKATCEVTVIPILANSISIDGSDIHILKQTENLQLTATVIPEDVTYQEVIWKSSDESKATVSNSGLVTAIEEGDVEITASLSYQPQITASYNLTIQKRLLGDANDNGIVNVADVGTISDYIVQKPVYQFCFVNADVITDGRITTADVTATVDIIFNDTPSMAKFATSRKISAVGNNELIVDNFNSYASSIVDVNLKNPSEFTGLQGSIIIPEGVTIKNVTKGAGARDHILNFNVTDRGTVEFILYSLQNASFKEMGALIELEIQADRESNDIIVENILASDKAANEYSLSFTGGKNKDIETSLDSIENTRIKIYSSSEGIVILNAQGENVNIFNIAGERIISTDAGSNREFYSLTKGIYIVTVKTETAKLIVK